MAKKKQNKKSTLIVNEDRFLELLQNVEQLRVEAALINTLDRNPELVEKDVIEFRASREVQKWSVFAEWFYRLRSHRYKVDHEKCELISNEQ